MTTTPNIPLSVHLGGGFPASHTNALSANGNSNGLASSAGANSHLDTIFQLSQNTNAFQPRPLSQATLQVSDSLPAAAIAIASLNDDEHSMKSGVNQHNGQGNSNNQQHLFNMNMNMNMNMGMNMKARSGGMGGLSNSIAALSQQVQRQQQKMQQQDNLQQQLQKNQRAAQQQDNAQQLQLQQGDNKPTQVSSSYRDFSRVMPDKPVQGSGLMASVSSSTTSTKEPTFPVKLHMILSNPDYQDIIAWLPHGRSWRILQQKAFEERVIPLYFRHGRYSSFARQVNGWGFRRITHGSDYNSYYHELFLRGMPHLCDRMRRLTTKDMSKRKKADEEPAPDFYAIGRDNPLPEISRFNNNNNNPSTSSNSLNGNGNSNSSNNNMNNIGNGNIFNPSSSFVSNNSLSAMSGSGVGGMSRFSPSATTPSMRSPNGTSSGSFAEMELAMLERRRNEILERMGAMTSGNNGLTNAMNQMSAGSSSFSSSLKDSIMNMPAGMNMLTVMQHQQQQQQSQQQSQRQQQMQQQQQLQDAPIQQGQASQFQNASSSKMPNKQQQQQPAMMMLQQQLLGNRLMNPDLAKILSMNNQGLGGLSNTAGSSMMGNNFGF